MIIIAHVDGSGAVEAPTPGRVEVTTCALKDGDVRSDGELSDDSGAPRGSGTSGLSACPEALKSRERS